MADGGCAFEYGKIQTTTYMNVSTFWRQNPIDKFEMVVIGHTWSTVQGKTWNAVYPCCNKCRRSFRKRRTVNSDYLSVLKHHWFVQFFFFWKKVH